MNTLLANPWGLWLLPVVSALTTLAVLAGYRRKRALAVVGGVLAMYRLTRVSRWPRLLRGALLGLGLTVLAVGVAGPQWGQEQTEITAGRDVVVVLDLSRSMLAEHRHPAARLGIAERASRGRGGRRARYEGRALRHAEGFMDGRACRLLPSGAGGVWKLLAGGEAVAQAFQSGQLGS